MFLVRDEENTMKTKNVKPQGFSSMVCCGDKVGDIGLFGMWHGSISNHYKLKEIVGKEAFYVPVEPKEILNSDGTYSTIYEEV
jgi:hypothetical protein